MSRLKAGSFQWQRAALGLLVLSTAVNAAQCAAVWSLGRQARDWQAKYQAAQAIKRDAIGAYGGLIRETEREKKARQEQAEAYEASVQQVQAIVTLPYGDAPGSHFNLLCGLKKFVL